MKRREFIAGLGGAAAWPLAARAQELNGRMRRIAVLIGGAETDPTWQAIAALVRETLAKLGWIEGRNLQTDLRFANGDSRRFIQSPRRQLRAACSAQSGQAPW
jgi:putative ABC transport system substrate-binding protein